MASVLDDGGEEHKSLMSGSSDPFYHFKDTLEQRISTLDTALQTLETTVKTTDTATSPLYRTQKKNCKKLLKGCESALRDLSATIRVVEQVRFSAHAALLLPLEHRRFAHCTTAYLSIQPSCCSPGPTSPTLTMKS